MRYVYYDRNIIGSSSAIIGNHQVSLESLQRILENTLKRLSGILLTFWEAAEIFRKCPEILGKSSLVCLCNEQNYTWLIVDMEFLFKCSTSYLTHSLNPLMR